jgi:hypothetical protein
MLRLFGQSSAVIPTEDMNGGLTCSSVIGQAGACLWYVSLSLSLLPSLVRDEP